MECPQCSQEKLVYEVKYARSVGPISKSASGAIFCYQEGCGYSTTMSYLKIILLAQRRKIYWTNEYEVQDLKKRKIALPDPDKFKTPVPQKS